MQIRRDVMKGFPSKRLDDSLTFFTRLYVMFFIKLYPCFRVIFTHSSSILESLPIQVILSGPVQIALNAIFFVTHLVWKKPAMYAGI